MANKRKVAPVFKDYCTSQLMLLPPSLDEMIDANHPVRTVNRVIDEIKIDPIVDSYKGGGTSSYNPRMLLKVLVYAYLCNVFSSRKIESSLKENIHFMWLSGMSRPDHNTINRFRSERLANVLKEIFSQVVMLLVESGQVNLKEVYIDGTKIEANANRYSFVWGKTIKNSEERISRQMQELWDYTQKIAADELGDNSSEDFSEIDAEKLNSETGIYHMRKRCVEVEPVFGNIKHNKGFRRFMLRGSAKTEVETGLIALAHNLAKMAA